MTAHIKHCLIAAGVLALCFFAVRAYVEMRVKLATIAAASAEKIKANEKTTAVATTNVATDQKAITVIDQDTKRKLDGLQAQLDSKPNKAEISGIIQAALPGVKTVEAKDAQGNSVLAVADTQENRDAINKKDVAFKTCQFNLDDCQQKQARYLDIIANKDTIIAAKQDTINTQSQTIHELTRFGKGGNFFTRTFRMAVPAGCGATAAGLAAQGGVKPKGVFLAGIISAGACALAIRF